LKPKKEHKYVIYETRGNMARITMNKPDMLTVFGYVFERKITDKETTNGIAKDMGNRRDLF